MLQMPSSKGNFDLAISARKRERESIERCKKSREGLNDDDDDDDDEEPSNRRLPHSLSTSTSPAQREFAKTPF